MSERLRAMLAPPHPTFRTKASRMAGERFIRRVIDGKKQAVIANIGSASLRLHPGVINLDLFANDAVDVQGDIHALPFRDGSVDAVVCTGVLEHVEDACLAVREIGRVLAPGGEAYIELPWMQGVHASPSDFRRWTPEGIKRLFGDMDVDGFSVAVGPASALAWQAQETLAMLFSCGSETIYRIGLRLFGWLMVPFSWFDLLLERHPEAWRVASGYAFVARKRKGSI